MLSPIAIQLGFRIAMITAPVIRKEKNKNT